MSPGDGLLTDDELEDNSNSGPGNDNQLEDDNSNEIGDDNQRSTLFQNEQPVCFSRRRNDADWSGKGQSRKCIRECVAENRRVGRHLQRGVRHALYQTRWLRSDCQSEHGQEPLTGEDSIEEE